MHDEELNMTSLLSKQKMTFAELFDRRLKTIPGKKLKYKLQFMLKSDIHLVLHPS